MRRLVVASAILATLLTTPLTVAAASPSPSVQPTLGSLPGTPTDSERATAALEYLLVAQSPDGSIDKSVGETADFVIAAAAAGYDPATLRGCGNTSGALTFLASASDAAASDAAKTGKAVLAVVAAGQDPTSFEGRDLVARLAALYHPGNGKYGDGATFGQSFAILAVVASGGTVPASALDELSALQGTDGSWGLGSTTPAIGEGDTNSTAIALMALVAAGVHSADAAALTYLASQQLADGGFPYQNSTAYGAPMSDPDSDAIVIQALVAVGRDPSAASWSKGSGNALTSLRIGQGADGGFAYPGSAANAFTTSQVPAALVRYSYGADVHPKAGASVPTGRCPNAVPLKSPAATAAATIVETATAGVSPTSTPGAQPSGSAGGSGSGGSGGWPTALIVGLVLIVALLVWFRWSTLGGRKKP